MQDKQNKEFKKNLLPINAWALAFGCVIGWGAFVMPGTTFLREAGPVGTAVAMLFSVGLMLIIAVNYHYMMNIYPVLGGTYTYTKKVFGHDHSFLCAWFLSLAYISVIPLNGTALALIARSQLHNTFQFGFHYTFAGYDIYFGEVIIAAVALIVFGILCIHAIQFTGQLQTVITAILVFGVIIYFVAALAKPEADMWNVLPAFQSEGSPFVQILGIILLAPWAFVGFDTISLATEEFKFSVKKSFRIMAFTVILGGLIYILVTWVAAAVVPQEYGNWQEYNGDLENLTGLKSLPAFYAAYKIMGNTGLIVLEIAALAAILSGIIGFYTASARLLFSMASDNILPKWFKTFRNCIIFIMCVSLVASFLGRTALGWIVDMSTLGAVVGFGYTSAAALKFAKEEENSRVKFTGRAGVALFILVFYSSSMWFIQNVIKTDMSKQVRKAMIRSSIVQLILILMGVSAVFVIYISMRTRERRLEQEKIRAEERNRAKTQFLSNMAHDIRTPMNAIIGFTNLALKSGDDAAKMQEYLSKISVSGDHLLALINDVLEMSRIEGGKLEIIETECDLCEMTEEIKVIVTDQMNSKKINFSMDTSLVEDSMVYCDRNHFNRVFLNLLSNAIKFTPEGGRISLSLTQSGRCTYEDDEYGIYELRVKDNGIGMTKEFAGRVFEAFEQERNSTVSGIQGTGLGMAITKSIIEHMGGTISVETEPGMGTEFMINVKLRLQKHADDSEAEDNKEVGDEQSDNTGNFAGKRVLVVDDNMVNREIAKEILRNFGFLTDEAVDGREAVDKVSSSAEGYYNAILMDIQMPVMNGYEAAKRIRGLEESAHCGIPIIALSANAFEEDIRAAKDSGMNGHVAKPIDIQALVQALAEVIDT